MSINRAIYGHREGTYPWFPIEGFVQEESARIVGEWGATIECLILITVDLWRFFYSNLYV